MLFTELLGVLFFFFFTNFYLPLQGDVGLPGAAGLPVSSHPVSFTSHYAVCNVRTFRGAGSVEMFSCGCDLKWLDWGFVNITAFFGRPGATDKNVLKHLAHRDGKVRHSGEESLCHITIAWEWVKQGADRQGSVGILTWAREDRHEQPGRERMGL